MSLIKLKNVPDMGVDYGDKIFHFLAYSVLTLFWFSAFVYYFKLKKSKAIVYAAILSVVFGILIEVLQGTFTVYRSLDVYDIVANTSGVILVVLVFVLKSIFDDKKI